jgi:transcriptional regulator with XRE-family HTH domain
MNTTTHALLRHLLHAQRSVERALRTTVLSFVNAVGNQMDRLNISKSDLANRAGVSRAHITQLMRGEANLTVETMTKLANALNCDLHIQLKRRCIATGASEKSAFPKGIKSLALQDEVLEIANGSPSHEHHGGATLFLRFLAFHSIAA